MNQKIDNNIKEKETLFNEEVAEEELHSKLGVDDHIYITNRRGIYGGPLLILFAVFLAFSALFALFYGLTSLNSDLNGRNIGVTVDEYHLKVIHSNYSYGGKIESFSKYNNSSKVFNYKFSIVNNNAVDLDYSVVLQVKDKDENLNVNLINYSLLRNGITVQSGNLSGLSNKLYSTTALKNSADEYEVRLWSNSINEDSGLNFRIKIMV